MTQTYPAKHIFTYTGLIGCEGAQVLHRWARGSDSRGHGDSQARRQERDTMTHRNVRTEVLIFFGLGIQLLLYFSGYISIMEPLVQMVARTTLVDKR